jgi:tetratricopeptide (TPR) repeat protein
MDSAIFERLAGLSAAGRHEDAIREALALAAEADDANDKAALLRGAAVDYCTVGRLGEARELVDALLKMHVTDPEVRLNIEFSAACLLVEEGKPDAGVAAFADMVRRGGTTLADQQLRYLYEAVQCRSAMALIGIRRFEEALSILREAVSFSFDSAEDEQRIYFALADCLSEVGDEESARQAFKRVIGFDLRNSTQERARYRFARLCFKARGFAQARQQLETILREFPPETAAVPRRFVYEQLSHTCRHLGDRKMAEFYAGLARG